MVIPSAALRRIVCAALLAASPGLATANQTDEIVFDLTLKGIRAGKLAINGKIEGNGYGVSGILQSSGILAALRKVRYDATAAGTVTGTVFRPARYRAVSDTGKRHSEVELAYEGGVPAVLTYLPERKPRAGDISAADQAGTIDTLTALYAVTRTIPAAEACTFSATMFDGRRRSQVTLSAPEKTDSGVTCAGEYRRIAGFSASDMAEKVRFPFRLTYAPAGDDMLRVVEISMDTLYGKGALKRR